MIERLAAFLAGVSSRQVDEQTGWGGRIDRAALAVCSGAARRAGRRGRWN